MDFGLGLGHRRESATRIYRDHRDTPGLTVEQVEAELEESFRTRMW
jgi:hypothetical protein